MLLFRQEEHIERWCRIRQLDRGATLTAEQIWRLGYEWYKDRLKPDWRRHTLEEADCTNEASSCLTAPLIFGAIFGGAGAGIGAGIDGLIHRRITITPVIRSTSHPAVARDLSPANPAKGIQVSFRF